MKYNMIVTNAKGLESKRDIGSGYVSAADCAADQRHTWSKRMNAKNS